MTTDWNTDMSAAPRDGTPILLSLARPIDSCDIGGYVPWRDISVVIGWWLDPRWLACFGDHHDSGCPTCGSWFEYPAVVPTAWMPLPEPMKEAPDGE